MMQVPITENQLGTMQMMEEISDHVVMNYPEIPDSRFVAQPVDDFLFPWEEADSAENPITIDQDEGFSETMTPQNTPPQQPPAMEPRPALRTSRTLLLLDSSLIKYFRKYLLFGIDFVSCN